MQNAHNIVAVHSKQCMSEQKMFRILHGNCDETQEWPDEEREEKLSQSQIFDSSVGLSKIYELRTKYYTTENPLAK